jgi:hypothetical protein
MYLSLYDFALNNPGIGTAAREFALFGINHRGTNCNWRTDAPVAAGTGMNPTNSDGEWFAIGAASGSITPADFDAILPGPLPNNANPGVLNDKVSNNSLSQNGVFKHPPFDAMNVTSATVANPGGGEPVDKWVDVSVEVTAQTNVSLFINRSPVLTPFSLNNGLLSTSYTNGTIMLGYGDPNRDESDSTAFALFSNVRVVEISPYISGQPGISGQASFIAAQFSSLTFTDSASFATAPITNVWYNGAVGALSAGVPRVALQTNTVNATSMTNTLMWTFNSAVDGTNYMSVFSDAAGSVTSTVVAVEVVLGPTNKTYFASATSNLLAVAAGPSAPTAFQWYFNTVSNVSIATKLANSAHYGGATTGNLFITNMVSGDAGFYWVAVTNAAGFVIPQAATLTLNVPAPTITSITNSGANVILKFTSPDTFDTSSSFFLQSSGVVWPYTSYTNNATGTFSGTNPNFQVSVPKNGDLMFYRLLHK